MKNNMNIHLKTILNCLVLIAIITAIYFFPVAVLVTAVVAFIYAAIYAEIQETEKRKKNQNDGR
jgi:Na+-translocating ferredoxin:NAD+ oxidoreductase RnfD subunit